MATIYLVKKESNVRYTPRAKAEKIDDARERIDSGTRVSRPGIVDLFMPTPQGRSKWARLPHATPGERRDMANGEATKKLMKEKAIKVDSADLGRGGKATPSQAQSILLWIKTRMAVGAAEAGLSVCSPDGDDVSVLYLDD